MERKINRILVTLCLLSAIISLPSQAETWRIDQSGQFKPVDQNEVNSQLSAINEIKELINSGQCDSVEANIKQLKIDQPEIAGSDFDAFMKAEILLCSGQYGKAARSYDSFLNNFRNSPFYDAALNRQFGIATAYLNGKKKRVLGFINIKGYAQGEKMMDNISDLAGNSPLAFKSASAIAQSLEERKKYTEAYHKWSEISSRFATSEIGRQALLGMARCQYLSYKGNKFDASCLISAKTYYQNYKERYPAEAQQINIDLILKDINEKLADKQLFIAQYYDKCGNSFSANLYYQMVIDQWPESKAAIKAREIMNESELVKETDN